MGGDMEQGQGGTGVGTSPSALGAAVVVAVALIMVLLKAQQGMAEQNGTQHDKHMQGMKRGMAKVQRQELKDWIKRGGEGAGMKED